MERYFSRRIRWVWRESQRAGKPMLILSGRYGLLTPQMKIPYYDHALSPAEVTKLAQKIIAQLTRRGVAALTFYARPRATPGWAPYFQVLEKACRRLDLKLHIRYLPDDFI
ncbi:hypothetical protein KJ068_29675 [bacterium]|nr:hypothetical protein [bacterium]MDL1878738.1 hypothetical protein [Cytophagia bacterium CHB2]